MRKALLIMMLNLLILSPQRFYADVKLMAIRVEQGPKLDGYLNDQIWQKAVPFVNFKMVEPTPGVDPTEKTELRIIYDENYLYIGIHCFDKNPSKISSNTMAHDNGGRGHSREDDLIKILLDPFQDKRNAYLFIVNPAGARSEGFATGEHSNLSWDGIWDAKSKIVDDGWTTEIKIPFKTISFKPGLHSWGLNVERYIPRKQEVIRISGINLNSFFTNPKEAAILQGIGKIRQGMGITFRPYGTGDLYRNYQGSNKYDGNTDAGFDIYKNFAPNLVGCFSYNTDFAETEVDERRINITRFPLFYPEKRTFFLEGSDIFNFGSGIYRSFIPFYSRRIGLYEGEQVPIEFGAKLFGKLGSTNVAVLDVKTRSSCGLSSENFFAGRIYQNILSESKIGLIYTNGSPDGGKNSLLGGDFIYNTSRLFGKYNFSIGLWGVYNWNELEGGNHHAYGFQIDYPNDLFDIAVVYTFFGDSLDPGIGFLPRKNYRYLYYGFEYMPRPEKGLIGKLVRQFFFEYRMRFHWNLKGELESLWIFTAPINLRTESGEHIEFNVIPRREVLPYDFEISEGVTIPAGSYDFTTYRFEFNSASFRKIQFDLSYRFGQFYDGTYHDIQWGAAFKYKGHVTLKLTCNNVLCDLPYGKFNENVYQIKADFFLTPDLGIMNYIQYDDISSTLGLSSRLRWRVSPGNIIYIVYNHNWLHKLDGENRFVPEEERTIAKIQLSFRL